MLEPGQRERVSALIGLAQSYEGQGDQTRAKDTYRTLLKESGDFRNFTTRHLGAVQASQGQD